MKDIRANSRKVRGDIDWRMNELQENVFGYLKDKKLVLLLSTHAMPIPTFSYIPISIVPQRNGVVQEDIPTSHMHLEFTTQMRGVHVVNHLLMLHSIQK